ncbi:sigma-70 family RNA polymerase sigma factor [candidate division KSB1 bacterium]|nr:sigma-70 family RNA polymerase sigma factor [candidate division KSB1 bacterium]
MIEHDDVILVKNCLNGDVKSFEHLIDKYQKTIFNMAYRLSNNYDDAEDITQSVFIKVYEQMNRYNSKYKFFSWLYRIALNESINHVNQRKKMTELDEDFISKEKSPEDEINDTELGERMQDALMEIEPENRILIILRHFEDLSYSEMAYILDISEKKVKSRLFSARQILKNVLIKKGIVGNDR